MAVMDNTVEVDLKGKIRFSSVDIGEDDESANRFGAKIVSAGNTVDISGASANGLFIREDNATIEILGKVENGVAYVVLTPECYDVVGRYQLTLKLVTSSESTTLRIVEGRVLKTRTNKSAGSVSGGGSVENDAAVPAYWMEHLEKRADNIRLAMSKAGWNKSAFLFYSDAHYSYNYGSSTALLHWLHNNTPINKVIFGGDIINAEGEVASTLDYLWDWRSAIRGLNHHSVPGNHDDGNEPDNRWPDSDIYTFLLAAEETPYVMRGDALYYYIDEPAEKTRYLYLDTATKDGNILNDPAQEAWLKQTLLSTPDGWHIVAAGHIWRVYHGSPATDNGWSSGATICLNMFDAYNARTGDFAAAKGKVEFCVGGHTHWDADHTSTGGIPVILVETDSKHVRSGLTCKAGTITENSVNAIVADYENDIVNVIRIGRGNSRIVKLDGSGSEDVPDVPVTPDEPDEPVEPDVPESDYDMVAPTGNFKNWLKFATEADGVTLYNSGHGYQNDIRLSTQSYEETAISGWDTTGFFPAKIGDVIRLHNVTLMNSDDNFASAGRAAVYCYDSSHNPVQSSSGFAPGSNSQDSWAPVVYGDNGDIIQFTLPRAWGSAAGIAYIRLVAKNITGASIITVNEEINL